MASAASDDDDGIISGINVTPLVDICLVLLIIMMVTARIIASLSVPMDLPKAAKGNEQQDHTGNDALLHACSSSESCKLDASLTRPPSTQTRTLAVALLNMFGAITCT